MANTLKPERDKVVTYRHLLSKQTLTPTNPLRCIAHCDIDAAYAQFMAVARGLPPEVPVACQQWGGLIAINYPARAFGITRHMDINEAKRRCPELVACHVPTYKEGEDEAGDWPDPKPETHKVSLEPFRRESLKILKIFSESCPTIEKASIDEAYMDFSQPVRELILERNPQLRQPPSDGAAGLDSPLPPPPAIQWEELGNLVPVLQVRGKDDHQQEGSRQDAQNPDEAAEDGAIDQPALSSQVEVPSDPTNAWSDYALSIGAELMQKCRVEVLRRLGYTCSAGVARNKILAKLCSAYRKPNAQTILRNDAIPGFLRPLKFTKIRSLGGKLGASIAEEYDAATVGDLWEVALHDFQAKVGSENGSWLYNVLRGVEHGEVAARTDVKSMLSSKNFKPSLTKWSGVSYWLRIIATDLYARINEARALSPGVWPKTIVLGVRDEKFKSRNRQASFPITNHLSIDYILKQGEKLMREYESERKNGLGFITNLQLSFAGLERAEKGQQAIAGFFGNGPVESSSSLKMARNPSNDRRPDAGSSSGPPGNIGKRRTATSSESVVDLTLDEDDILLEDASEDNRKRSTSNIGEIANLSSADVESDSSSLIEVVEPDGPVYRCALCNAVMSIKQDEDIAESLEDATERVRARHDAWHGQQDQRKKGLTTKSKRKAEDDSASTAVDKHKKDKKKKKRKGQQRLNNFFSAKSA